MPPNSYLCGDLPEMVLRLAGEAGQVSLALTADQADARARVDQHASEIRDKLTRHGRELTPTALLSYVQGFMEAAIARGWWPAHRRARLEDAPWLDDEKPALDWESLRLAAVCQMLIEAQGLGI
jgi:hypothetical protein